jgi:hypothetical protein
MKAIDQIKYQAYEGCKIAGYQQEEMPLWPTIFQ